MDSSNRITQKKNPRDTANFFSICFFWWVTFEMQKKIRIVLDSNNINLGG